MVATHEADKQALSKNGNGAHPTPRSQAIAIYSRVSSEDQTERATIEGQRDFLRNYAALMGLHIAQTYEDNGVSGAVPLAERPGGRQLLEDARHALWSRHFLPRGQARTLP
jgi:DNA invertase Pin-like site-specific DNA recombinase